MKNSKNCFSDLQLRAFFSNEMTEQEKKNLKKHVASCRVCRRKLLETKLLKLGAEIGYEREKINEHVDEIQISAYDENELDGTEKTEVEHHLLVCEDCWEQFIALETMKQSADLSQLPEPESEFVKAVGKIIKKKETKPLDEIYKKFIIYLRSFHDKKLIVRFAGAAVVLILLAGVVLSVFYQQSHVKIPLRDISMPETRKVILLSPKIGEKIIADKIVFSWQLQPRISQYHFILFNEIGTKIFDEFTHHSSVKFDAKILPSTHCSYFWRVVGLLENGDKIESDLSYFYFSGQKR